MTIQIYQEYFKYRSTYMCTIREKRLKLQYEKIDFIANIHVHR